MEGMTQFPGQTSVSSPQATAGEAETKIPVPSPIEPVKPIAPLPPLPEMPKPLPATVAASVPRRETWMATGAVSIEEERQPKKRIWLTVLFWVATAIVLIVGFLVYYGAPDPNEVSFFIN